MLGYLQDTADERDFDFNEVGPSLYGVGRAPDLREFCVDHVEQGRANSCVGFAISRAIHIHMVRDAAGAGLKEPEMPAPGWIYYNARAAELIGKPPSMSPLPDRGCFPRLAMKSVQKLGFLPWSELPYEPQKINVRPRMALYTKAMDMSGLRYYRISSVGQQRVEEVSRALSLGYPCIMGMNVDKAFRNLGRAPAADVNMKEILGGHAMCVVAIDSSGVVLTNTWENDWGCGGGFGRITAALFGSSHVADIYAISAAPVTP